MLNFGLGEFLNLLSKLFIGILCMKKLIECKISIGGWFCRIKVTNFTVKEY